MLKLTRLLALCVSLGLGFAQATFAEVDDPLVPQPTVEAPAEAPAPTAAPTPAPAAKHHKRGKHKKHKKMKRLKTAPMPVSK